MIKLLISKRYRDCVRLLGGTLAGAMLFGMIFPPIAEANVWEQRRKAQAEQEAKKRRWEIAAAPQIEAQAAQADLNLPESVAQVVESHIAASTAPVIIHVQDAHGYVTAQENLAKILEQLKEPSGTPLLVAAEGAWKKVDLEWLHVYPSKKILKGFADHLLKHSQATGEEYAAMLAGESKFEVQGIEDEKLYWDNVRSREELEKVRDDVLEGRHVGGASLRFISERIAQAAERVYPAELREYERKRKAQRGGKLTVAAYLAHLESAAGTRWSEIAGAELVKLNALTALERNLDGAQVTAERGRVLQALSENLDKNTLARLAERSVQFRLGRIKAQEYYAGLMELAKIHGLAAPALDSYARCLKTQDSIDIDRVNDELAALEAKLEQSLSGDNKEVLKWLSLSRRVELEEHLWKLDMAPQDWAAYRKTAKEVAWSDVLSALRPEERGAQIWKDFNASLDRHRPAALHYFEAAQKRDQVLAENALRLVQDRKASRAVLVAGGFHTEGILRHLRQSGASYIVVRPKIGSLAYVKREPRFTEKVREAHALRDATLFTGALTSYFTSILAAMTAMDSSSEEIVRIEREWREALEALAASGNAPARRALDSVLYVLPAILTQNGQRFMISVGANTGDDQNVTVIRFDSEGQVSQFEDMTLGAAQELLENGVQVTRTWGNVREFLANHLAWTELSGDRLAVRSAPWENPGQAPVVLQENGVETALAEGSAEPAAQNLQPVGAAQNSGSAFFLGHANRAMLAWAIPTIIGFAIAVGGLVLFGSHLHPDAAGMAAVAQYLSWTNEWILLSAGIVIAVAGSAPMVRLSDRRYAVHEVKKEYYLLTPADRNFRRDLQEAALDVIRERLAARGIENVVVSVNEALGDRGHQNFEAQVVVNPDGTQALQVSPWIVWLILQEDGGPSLMDLRQAVLKDVLDNHEFARLEKNRNSRFSRSHRTLQTLNLYTVQLFKTAFRSREDWPTPELGADLMSVVMLPNAKPVKVRTISRQDIPNVIAAHRHIWEQFSPRIAGDPSMSTEAGLRKFLRNDPYGILIAEVEGENGPEIGAVLFSHRIQSGGNPHAIENWTWEEITDPSYTKEGETPDTRVFYSVGADPNVVAAGRPVALATSLIHAAAVTIAEHEQLSGFPSTTVNFITLSPSNYGMVPESNEKYHADLERLFLQSGLQDRQEFDTEIGAPWHLLQTRTDSRGRTVAMDPTRGFHLDTNEGEGAVVLRKKVRPLEDNMDADHPEKYRDVSYVYKIVPPVTPAVRPAALDAARQKFVDHYQRYIDLLSREDSVGTPDVFVLFGNSDLRVYIEFARRWLEISRSSKRQIPIILAGGRGRGTVPLIRKMIAAFPEGENAVISVRKNGESVRMTLGEALSNESGANESDLMRAILVQNGVAEEAISVETAPSRNTSQNFENTTEVVKEKVAGISKPVIALVGWPPLLTRLKATANKSWAEFIAPEWEMKIPRLLWPAFQRARKALGKDQAPDWVIARFRSFDLRADEMSDEELYENGGYTLGYPEKFVVRHWRDKLNWRNEIGGTQEENNPSVVTVPLTEMDWNVFASAKRAFRAFVDEYRPDPLLHSEQWLSDRGDPHMIFGRDYPNPWMASIALYVQQIQNDFFKILETGSVVQYVTFPKDGTPYRLHHVAVPDEDLDEAEILFVHNQGRARRPGAPSLERLRDDDMRTKALHPSVRPVQNPNQYVLEMRGVSGNGWHVLYNNYPIFPPIPSLPAESQFHHQTVARSDGAAHQRDILRSENLRDLLEYMADQNAAPELAGQTAFRLGINGWYYSDSPDAVKAGASQDQMHGQVVRIRFPVENAPLTAVRNEGAVTVSRLSDGIRPATVLEADAADLEELSALTARILAEITRREWSFNILAAPAEGGKVRIYIFARVRGIPYVENEPGEPEFVFTNEFGFSEVSGAIVIDNPDAFYADAQARQGLLPGLREKALRALGIVNATEEQMDDVLDHVFRGPDGNGNGNGWNGSHVVGHMALLAWTGVVAMAGVSDIGTWLNVLMSADLSSVWQGLSPLVQSDGISALGANLGWIAGQTVRDVSAVVEPVNVFKEALALLPMGDAFVSSGPQVAFNGLEAQITMNQAEAGALYSAQALSPALEQADFLLAAGISGAVLMRGLPGHLVLGPSHWKDRALRSAGAILAPWGWTRKESPAATVSARAPSAPLIESILPGIRSAMNGIRDRWTVFNGTQLLIIHLGPDAKVVNGKVEVHWIYRWFIRQALAWGGNAAILYDGRTLNLNGSESLSLVRGLENESRADKVSFVDLSKRRADNVAALKDALSGLKLQSYSSVRVLSGAEELWKGLQPELGKFNISFLFVQIMDLSARVVLRDGNQEIVLESKPVEGGLLPDPRTEAIIETHA